MKNKLQIGLIVADDTEYVQMEKMQNLTLKPEFYYKRGAHCFEIKKGDKVLEIHSYFSGMGMVNAATAAMYAVDHGAEILLNYGYSGGIFGVSRYDMVLGTTFLEHDFDLTGIGYDDCEKPGQEYIYKADERLNRCFKTVEPSLKCGAMGSGDGFVSDDKLKAKLRDKYHITCCDMESAAVASVAHMCDIPFTAVRQVSDDAGDSAKDAYREMAYAPETELFERFFALLNGLFDEESLWR